MKKTIIQSIFLTIFVSINIYSQGLNFTSDEDLANLPQIPADYGFAGNLPSYASMEKYVPSVIKQRGGTCVGFASFYYGMSTMYNMKFGITSSREKFVHAFDPYFIYSIVFNNVQNCDNGLRFDQALGSAYKIGTKKLLFPPFTTCKEDWDEKKLVNAISYTKPYSIDNWFSTDTSSPDFVNVVKRQIAGYTPVIIGMQYLDSMGEPYSSVNGTGVGSNGLWLPNPSEKATSGHAMCVVGYDDNKFGGAFRIVNSWGRGYGDNGYLWVRYKDFKRYTKEAYVMKLNENVTSNYKLKEGIKGEEYRRYGYMKNGKLSTYEGEYKGSSVSGYGIWLDPALNTYYIGKYNNGSMNGYFMISSDEGLYSAVARNGKFEDITKLGFGGEDDDIRNEQISAMKYFDNFGIELGIRKANSTSSTLGPSINE